MKKNIIYTSIISLLALIGILFFASNYLLNYSLKPENRGKDLQSSYEFIYKNYPYLEPWVDSLKQVKALKDTFIYADDGTKLHAYYIFAAQPTKRTATIVHGYTDNAIRMFMIGYLYNHDLGFNVLLPDLRDSGLSGGDYIQMGWFDRLDVMQWMKVANQLYGGSTQMVVHGISMGAATTMMVSGEPQPKFVKCFVEDCGYTSVWDEFSDQLKEEFHLPNFPLLYSASLLCQLKYGWNFKEASALKQVEKCLLPMLFIHGSNDSFVSTKMVYKLYQAKPQPKELWIVPGAKHALSYKEKTQEYVEKVKNFVNRYIH